MTGSYYQFLNSPKRLLVIHSPLRQMTISIYYHSRFTLQKIVDFGHGTLEIKLNLFLRYLQWCDCVLVNVDIRFHSRYFF